MSATEFVDESLIIGNAEAPAGASETTYYYAVTTVDADLDESPLSSEISPTPEPVPAEDNSSSATNTGSYVTGDKATVDEAAGNDAGDSTACFISTAAPTDASIFSFDPSISTILGLLALIGLLWLGKKKGQVEVKGKRLKVKGSRKIPQSAKDMGHREKGFRLIVEGRIIFVRWTAPRPA